MVWTLLLSILLMSVAIRGQRMPWTNACSADIVFIVDDSSSIPSAEFDFAKLYITRFPYSFTTYHQEIGIGVILFNCAPRTGIPLGTYTTTDKAGLGAAVSQLVQKGGLSKIGLAIRFMADTSNFRAGVPRVAVLLTDGMAQSDVNAQGMVDYETQAEAARNAGIDLYAVGLGPKSSVAIDVLETITGSADRVFWKHNSDPRPRKLAYRILANLCAAAATDGCLYNGVLIPVGEEWKPDDCTWCTCPAAGEDPVCAVQDCAPPPCSDPVKIAGQCCRVCDPPLGCLENGAIIPVGEVYETPDRCTWCRCDADGAEPMCAAVGCALDPGCTNHVRIAGQCCPTCPACCHGCQHGDDIMPFAAIYQPDPCTNCFCNPNGAANCDVTDCAAPPCTNYVTVPGQCCPTCPDGDGVPVMPPMGDEVPVMPPIGDDGPVMPPIGDDGPVMPPMGDDGPPYQPPRVMPPDMPPILGR